jgi:hypothetical protein
LTPRGSAASIPRGGIAVETVDITLSEAAEQAERDAPGDPADALVWQDIEQSAGEETRLSVTDLAFMIVAPPSPASA